MQTRFLLSQGALQICCKLLAPEDGQIRRLVLSVHGLGGNMEDGIQRGIAEEMELFSSAVLRFDFPAHGESPMDSRFFTLPHCRESLRTAAAWLRAQYPQVEDLCIFATGFGAYITLLELENLRKLPGTVKLVVQTPSVLMHETLLAMKQMTEPTLAALERVTLRTTPPVEITYDFYCDLRDHIALAAYPIPMLILHSQEDGYIRRESIRNFRRINEQSKLVIIPGTSHRFQEEGAWDMVLDLTRDWFEFQQVLCCDWE